MTFNLPKPKSRHEKFLNAIAKGDTTNLPVPKSRNEIFLDFIAKNGGTGEGLTQDQKDKLNSIPAIKAELETLKNNYGEENGNINSYEHSINTTPKLKLGYNNIIATGQKLTLPLLKDDTKACIVKLFVDVKEKGNNVNFGDVEIFWNSEPNFSKVGVYKIELERSFNYWIGTCVFCVSNDPTRNPVYLEIQEKLKQNNYTGLLQVIESDVKEDNDIIVFPDANLNLGDKIKTYYYNDGKFYWLNTESVIDGTIRFKSNGIGTYFIASNDAPIFDKSAMELVYNETFENDDIDSTKWVREVHEAGWTNDELQYYTDSINNSYIEDGKLVIKAIKEKYENGEYTSARLISKDSFLYGRFDIKAKLPTGKGMWPAIWMMPKDNIYGEWPKSGEIDIMENVGKEPEWIHASLHSEKYNFRHGNQVTSKIEVPTNFTEFHTYSVIWTPEYIEFLVDDVSYLKHNYDDKKESSRWESYPYDKPYNIILNLAVGGNWGGEVDDTILPNCLYIDSVKVYDLGFAKFDKTKPNDVTGLKFLDNVLSWDYCHDNVSVKEYKISLNNGKVLTTANNYLVLNPIDTLMSNSASVVSIDYSENKSDSSVVNYTPYSTNFICNETKPLIDNWNTYADETANITITQGDKGVILDIIKSGANPWDVQLMKNNYELIPNTRYAYSLSLSSSINRNIKFVIQNQENYQGLEYNDIYLEANNEKILKGNFLYTGEAVTVDFVLQLGNDSNDYSSSKLYLNSFVFAEVLN